MAAPMWRMNGVWRRLAGVLVLCTLLLSNEVMSQDGGTIIAIATFPAPNAKDAHTVTDAAVASANVTAAGNASADPTVAASGQYPSPATSSLPSKVGNATVNPDSQDGDSSGAIAAPVAKEEVTPAAENHNEPAVSCVGYDKISESDSLTFEVETADCEETKRIMVNNSPSWCERPKCDVKIFQNGKKLIVASDDIKLSALAEALQRENLKDELGVRRPPSSSPPSSSSGSSVFVGVLVSGLLAAIAITLGYCKCQRRSDPKGVRLAEEAYPVDQENQGNTLVSVAPLNPPAETQEKPSVNGESTEAAKTQPPPPTNGHPATKTADTEM